MLAINAIQGRRYRVLACPQYEYLTIGQVYVCTTQTRGTTGMHRPEGGYGTYLCTRDARTNVVLEAID